MSQKLQKILKVAIDCPLRQVFDYLAPETMQQLQPGMRVTVPFGRRKLTGMIDALSEHSHYDKSKLKFIEALLDEKPLLSENLLNLLGFIAAYYQAPFGELIFNALPKALRLGEDFSHFIATYKIHLNEDLKLTPAQKALADYIQANPGKSLVGYQLQGFSPRSFEALKNLNLLAVDQGPQSKIWHSKPSHIALNAEQLAAISQIKNQPGFQVFLLDGVTGSGKTEIYLQIIAAALAQNQQALVLVPEINLTPQTIQRFKARFQAPIYPLHSALNELEKLNAWLKAKTGEAAIIIGTRSAVFAPLENLGVIVVDEEHDLSFKQQTGTKYHARDVAIMRAKLSQIPIILGSATPSLESIAKVKQGKFQEIKLTKRAVAIALPNWQVIDLRGKKLKAGLSDELIEKIAKQLLDGHQVMLFLNRRGMARSFLCHICGYIAHCKRCDAHLTLHETPKRLICHHCGGQQMVYQNCPECQSQAILSLGVGTERLELELKTLFPRYKTLRIDRDTSRNKKDLETNLNSILNFDAQILIGTQMLAKGHHFPRVSLVALVDVDSSLYCGEFHASERLAQLITQVAGRAGREMPGEVILQTHHPEHHLLRILLENNYQRAADFILTERELTQLPPFTHLILWRAESLQKADAENFLNHIARLAKNNKLDAVKLLGPMPAMMEKRLGKYRMQLILQASHRKTLHDFNQALLSQAEALKIAKKCRWSVDIDPQEVF